MPAQATQTEEENLIILDDVVSDDILESSDEIKIKEPESSENIIDFGNNSNDKSSNLDLGDFNIDNSKQDEIVEDKKEEVETIDLVSDISSDLDLGDLNIDDSKQDEIVVEDKKEEVETIDLVSDTSSDLDLGDLNIDDSKQDEIVVEDKKEEVLDLGLGNSSISTISDTSSDLDSNLVGGSGFQDDLQTQNDSSDLNSILEGTIVKLQSRAEVISQDKTVEQDNIKDYKDQISTLEDNVANSEGIVSTLNKEAAKIRSNIKSLERMKLKDEVEEVKKETSTKVHNSKRGR